MTKAADKIIVALDVAAEKEALNLVAQLRGDISFFKVGLQLYTAAGPEIVRKILADGAKVFLDLKLHDIPNTVARAVESAAELGVQMLTIHLSGGTEMTLAAVADPECSGLDQPDQRITSGNWDHGTNQTTRAATNAARSIGGDRRHRGESL